MRGILADVNCEGHVERLLHLMRDDARREFWEFMKLEALRFADIGLDVRSSDRVVWETCQTEHLVLISSNRSSREPDSLEATIRELNIPESLPVLTVANPDRVLADREYAGEVADRILRYLFDIDTYRGAGRLFVP